MKLVKYSELKITDLELKYYLFKIPDITFLIKLHSN